MCQQPPFAPQPVAPLPLGVTRAVPVPPLVLPTEKSKPVPGPESDSIQVLRAVLAERRRERGGFEYSRIEATNSAEVHESRACEQREDAARAGRNAAAADAAISALLGDIEKLGGAPE